MKTAAIIFYFCLFAVFSIAVKREVNRETSPVAALKLGEAMPDFAIPDVNGKEVRLSEVLRDKKVVVINFWASWCGPCRVEMPSLEQIYSANKDKGFLLLAIAEDDQRAKLDAYLKEHHLSFPILIDREGAVAKQLKIESLPTTILLGAGGKVRRVHEGVHPYLSFEVESFLNDPKRK